MFQRTDVESKSLGSLCLASTEEAVVVKPNGLLVNSVNGRRSSLNNLESHHPIIIGNWDDSWDYIDNWDCNFNSYDNLGLVHLMRNGIMFKTASGKIYVLCKPWRL